MPERLGDGPIQPEYRAQMQAVAVTLDEFFNGDSPENGAALKAWLDARKVGFVLMVFPYGETDTGRCNYISNGAGRNDVVTLMKEMIARFEGQPEMTGKA